MSSQADGFKQQGNAYLQQGNYKAAIQCFDKAISLAKNAIYYSNRALCYLNLQQYQRALQDTMASLQLEPTYMKNKQRHAEILVRLGRPEEALPFAQELFNAEQTTKNRELLNETQRALDLKQNFSKKVADSANHLLQAQAFLLQQFSQLTFPIASSETRSKSQDEADNFMKQQCAINEAAFETRQKLDEVGAKSLLDDVKFWRQAMPTLQIDDLTLAFLYLVMQCMRNACNALVQYGSQGFYAESEDVNKQRYYFVQQSQAYASRIGNKTQKSAIECATCLLQQNTQKGAEVLSGLAAKDAKFAQIIQQYKQYEQLKTQGSNQFKQNQFAQAETLFLQAGSQIFDPQAFLQANFDPFVALIFMAAQFLAAQTLSNAAMAYNSQNNKPKALEYFSQATFLDCYYSKAHMRAAKIYQEAGMFKEAENTYSLAAAVDPSLKLADIIQNLRKQQAPFNRQDYYGLIGISKDTVIDSDEYKKAYKRTCMKFHPDRFARDPVMKRFGEWKFRLIQEADKVLHDKNKKMIYDQGGDPENEQGGMGGMGGMPMDMSDIFSMFGGGRGGGNVQFTVNGQPVDASAFGGFPGGMFGGFGGFGDTNAGRGARGNQRHQASGLPPGMGDIFSQLFNGF